jgi:ribosomal protein L30E
MVGPKVVRKLESNLSIISRSGKILFGKYSVLWALRNEPEKIKVIILCRNPPPTLVDELNTVLSDMDVKVPVILSKKTNIELGEAIGRPHSVSILAIYDFGTAPFSEDELYE